MVQSPGFFHLHCNPSRGKLIQFIEFIPANLAKMLKDCQQVLMKCHDTFHKREKGEPKSTHIILLKKIEANRFLMLVQRKKQKAILN